MRPLFAVVTSRPRRGVVAGWLAGLLVAGLLAGDPASAVTLFGLVDTGELYTSGDGGVNWVIRSTLPVRDAVGLAAGATSSELFLASESGSFYRSTDAGVNWTAVGAVSAADVAALDSYPGRLLLLTASGSVYASVDNGSTFTPVGTITASDVESVTHKGAIYFALTRTGGVYRSDDAGASWAAVGTLTTSNAVEIVNFQGKLYVLTATGDLARSDDQGVSWSFISTLSQSGMTSVTATGAEIIASTFAGEAAATPDGAAWTWRGVIGQLNVMALANDLPNVIGVPEEPPVAARLFLGPWPNPAQGVAELAFELPSAARVTLTVHDAAGRRVARPIAGEVMPAGRTVRAWRPPELPSGAYYLQAQVGDQARIRKLIWIGGR